MGVRNQTRRKELNKVGEEVNRIEDKTGSERTEGDWDTIVIRINLL